MPEQRHFVIIDLEIAVGMTLSGTGGFFLSSLGQANIFDKQKKKFLVFGSNNIWLFYSN